MKVESRNGGHGGKASHQQGKLPRGIGRMLVEFRGDHFNTADKQEGAHCQTIQYLAGNVVGQGMGVGVHEIVQDHAADNAQGG